MTPLDFHTAIAVRTFWGEARGEGLDGLKAVAHVILNRLARGYAKTLAGVCLAPFQFSCWLSRSKGGELEACTDVSEADLYFQQALEAWRGAMLEAIDPTAGATHYKVIGTPAKWVSGDDRIRGTPDDLKPCAVIRRHEFYNNVH